jgi:hypothetical protein
MMVIDCGGCSVGAFFCAEMRYFVRSLVLVRCPVCTSKCCRKYVLEPQFRKLKALDGILCDELAIQIFEVSQVRRTAKIIMRTFDSAWLTTGEVNWIGLLKLQYNCSASIQLGFR